MPRRPILKAKRNRRPNRTAESEKRCWAGAEHDHRTHRNTSPPFLQLGGASYDGITNMEPRRKVGYRPRSHRAPKRATSHSARRSHATFLALSEERRVRPERWTPSRAPGATPPGSPRSCTARAASWIDHTDVDSSGRGCKRREGRI